MTVPPGMSAMLRELLSPLLPLASPPPRKPRPIPTVRSV